VAWALLSQCIWLPLLVIDLQDRWQAYVGSQAPRAGIGNQIPLLPEGQSRTTATLLPSAPGALASRGPASSTGLLLGSGAPAGQGQAGSRAASFPGSPTGAFTIPAAPASSPPAGQESLSLASPSPGLLQAQFSRAELLGGPISLADLNARAIPPLALAEQGRRTLSGDPMAALPEAWREPMRRALQGLPTPGGAAARIGNARLIHIPSRRVSAPAEVPLALQSDGSVDILSRPREEAVVEEIRDWSAKQAPPSEGSVTPAVVHLHPIEEAAPIRPPQMAPAGTAMAEPGPDSETKPASP
jgi:hypothetical protein